MACMFCLRFCLGGTAKVGIRFGRQTCADPLNSRKVQNLPDGSDPHACVQVKNQFRLTDSEVVALLGK